MYDNNNNNNNNNNSNSNNNNNNNNSSKFMVTAGSTDLFENSPLWKLNNVAWPAGKVVI